jgi:hypothetical protein
MTILGNVCRYAPSLCDRPLKFVPVFSVEAGQITRLARPVPGSAIRE